jgi:outer membrane immunogenic protein
MVALASPAAAQNFDGFRVEARGGYDSITLDADYADANSTASADNNEDGFGFGAEIGYDFSVGPGFILGGYAGIDFSDSDFCNSIDEVEELCLEASRTSTSAPAAAWWSHLRPWSTASSATRTATPSLDLDDAQDIIDDFSDSGSRDGWHFGAGVEQNFGPMFYGKLEYVYTIYSDLDFASPDAALVIDGNRSQVMAGLGLRF